MASVKKRVLIVEDEPGLVMTLTDRLESEGYDVGAASDGPAGLQQPEHAPARAKPSGLLPPSAGDLASILPIPRGAVS